MIQLIITSLFLIICLIMYMFDETRIFILALSIFIFGINLFGTAISHKSYNDEMYDFHDFKTEYNKALESGGCTILLDKAVEWNLWLKKGQRKNSTTFSDWYVPDEIANLKPIELN